MLSHDAGSGKKSNGSECLEARILSLMFSSNGLDVLAGASGSVIKAFRCFKYWRKVCISATNFKDASAERKTYVPPFRYQACERGSKLERV
jgi:hypothetical protein